MKIERLIALVVVCWFLTGCGIDSAQEGENQTENQVGNQTEDPYDGPTYHDDIKPLMEANCTSCHVQDSIAPFALETFDEVRTTALLSHASMMVGDMPPWPPEDECGTFQGRRGVTAAEIEIFEEWMDLGFVEGEPPGTEEQELGSGSSPLGDRQPDLTLDWGFDYKPNPVGGDGVDDYRCFVVDPELTEDRFVNLVDTRPGNPAQVHHMIAYIANSNQAGTLAQLEAEDEDPGYTCFGGPRINAEMLAGWVPGSLPFPYKEGHGVRLAAGSRLVVQMHYNTLNDPDGTDRTELDLYFVDEEEHSNPVELVIVPLAQNGLFVEAGDPDAVAVAEGPEIPLPISLHGIAPHMHMLGTEIRVDAQTGDGDICLINIPRWDFNWQGFYLYEEPISLMPIIQTRLTCRYDNSPQNQPQGREPRDVYWGDGTFDEMCLVYFIIERPPGF